MDLENSEKALKPYVSNLRTWTKDHACQQASTMFLLNLRRLNTPELEQMSQKKFYQKQLHKLSALVDYAFSCIPFYRDIYQKAGYHLGAIRSFKDFKALPLITKSDLRILYESQIKIEKRGEFWSRTSGSTGSPLILINDFDRTRHWFVERILMFEKMLGKHLNPTDWIYNYYYEPFWLPSIMGGYKTYSVDLLAPPKDVAKHIYFLRPKVVTGVASKIIELIGEISNAKDYGIELFATNSESSSKRSRDIATLKTGVPVLDEYSSEELGIIAWENKDRKYSLAEESVHVELNPIEHCAFSEVVGTCLWSYTMPRIRYIQGDYASWTEESKKIDLDNAENILYSPRMFETLEGRQDMALFSPIKGIIKPSEVLTIIDSILMKYAEQIIEFRLLQLSNIKFKMLLKSNNNFCIEVLKAEFCTALSLLLEINIEIDFEFVSFIPRLGTKHRCIIRCFSLPKEK